MTSNGYWGAEPWAAEPGDGAVSLADCSEYAPGAVRDALHEALAALGGMGRFVRPGEGIALKPNLLLAVSPAAAITTHPAVIEAVADEVRAVGGHPFVVESGGAGVAHARTVLRTIYSRTGVAEVGERTGLPLNGDLGRRSVSYPRGRLIRRFELMTPLLEAEGIISLPKLKTHTYMVLSGAVKNLFRTIPGAAKVGFHAKLADPRRFADMLLDLAETVRPRLTIMDAVVGLEGDGPGARGRPKPIGMLLAGTDPVAMDVVSCRLTGIPPERVPVLMAAAERGMWDPDGSEVSTLGPRPEERVVAGFQLPRTVVDESGFGRIGLHGLLRPVLKSSLSEKPIVIPEVCTGCGKCAGVCPKKAIGMEDSRPRIDYEVCIRCYCCHELCPQAAIDLVSSRVGSVLRKAKLG